MGGDWPQGKIDKKLGSNLEDPRPHPCCLSHLSWVTCLQGRQPREPRSPGGRQDQPHPSARPCLRAQAGKGGRGVVQFLTNRLYWKNPIYIQTLGGPALAQLAGGGSRSAGSLQLAWGSGSGGGELPPPPPWPSPLASLCSSAWISTPA